MTCAEHDKVYSGQIQGQRYAFICRTCGACGWAREYVIPNVDNDEYLRLRVEHGWVCPLPRPPRVPVIFYPPKSLYRVTAGLFLGFFVVLAALGFPWGGEAVLERWQSLVGSGLALGIATVCYVCWKLDT